MKRLTKKVELQSGEWWVQGNLDLPAMVGKLGDLEDIEDEIDISLIVLFEALKQGFIFTDFGMEHIEKFNFGMPYIGNHREKLLINFSTLSGNYYCKEYKKTWWLTRTKEE